MKVNLIRAFIAVAIGLGAYFAYAKWQIHIGETALKATALEFLPFESALVRSKAEGKPLLVDFSATWCPTCRAMHSEVFTNEAVKQAIAERYVLARVDADSPEAPAFMHRYTTKVLPSILIISSDGALLRRIPVVLDPTVFARFLHS
jgi:thiol:disulfide interchange protein